MFKKTLLALALTGVAGVASAATIGQTAIEYSAEGIVNETLFDIDTDIAATRTAGLLPAAAGGNETGSVVVAVGIDNGYQVGDKIVFTFPNDVFDISSNASIAAFGTADPGLTVGAPVYSGGNSVSFTITAATAVTKANAVEIVLEGVNLAKANLQASGNVDATFSVISSVNNTSYEVKTATIAKVATELSLDVTTKANEVIDVNKSRKEFVGGAKTDDVVVDPAAKAGVKLGVTVSKTVYTLKGDFSFLDTDGDGKDEFTITATGSSDNSVTVAADYQSATVTDTSANMPAVTFTVEATDGKTVIPATTFTAETAVTYQPNTAGNVATVANFSEAAGSWTLNGASVNVPYMPYGTNISQIIYVTNTSALAGEVEVTATGEDGTVYELGVVATAGKGVTRLHEVIATKLEEAGFNMSGKVAFDVVVNAPEGNITVYAAYKVGEDRALVNTDQYKGKINP